MNTIKQLDEKTIQVLDKNGQILAASTRGLAYTMTHIEDCWWLAKEVEAIAKGWMLGDGIADVTNYFSGYEFEPYDNINMFAEDMANSFTVEKTDWIIDGAAKFIRENRERLIKLLDDNE